MNILFSYIIFGIGFILSAKIFNIIVDNNIDSLLLYINGNLTDKLQFIFNGYSFIGGYLGGICLLIFYCKIIKLDYKKILSLYLPSLLLLYSVLKFICLTLDCCKSSIIPIQLIEIISSFILYTIIYVKYKNLSINKIIGLSLLFFGSCRFVLSVFRDYIFSKSFYIIEIICLIFICIGIFYFKKKK